MTIDPPGEPPLAGTDIEHLIGPLERLRPGGAKTFLSAPQARALPATGEHKIKALDKELKALVIGSGAELMTWQGIGPVTAARLIGDVGDIARFPTEAHFASWNGTAPIDASSGENNRHRLSRTGNRRPIRVLRIMAIVRLRDDTEGRRYIDRKKASVEFFDGSDAVPSPSRTRFDHRRHPLTEPQGPPST